MKRIGVVVFPGFQILDMVAVSVFELANLGADSPAYEIEVISEHGGPVRSSSGVQVESKAFDDPSYDTVVVTGAMFLEPSSPGLCAFLNRALASSRRTTSICTGAFVLAEAGILDGKRVTTHWSFARELQHRFPKTKVDDDRIFIVDGSVWTSAGMTACIDLCLALVEADLGVEASRSIAKKLVVYHRRTGGQSQYSAMLDLQPRSDRIQTALTWASLGRNARGSRASESAPVQSRISRRNAAVASESHRKPARRSGALDDRNGASLARNRRCGDRVRGYGAHASGIPARVRSTASGNQARGACLKSRAGACWSQAISQRAGSCGLSAMRKAVSLRTTSSTKTRVASRPRLSPSRNGFSPKPPSTDYPRLSVPIPVVSALTKYPHNAWLCCESLPFMK
jgi:putative intracellular protease/amidase